MTIHTLRAGLYVRTSTAHQHPEAQLTRLRGVARQRSWRVIDEFVDADVSSRRKRRPRYEAMKAVAAAGEVDIVVAVGLDRFARSTRELLDLGESLRAWGVDLVSLREQLDTTTPAGKLTFTLLAAIAEFERELIRERVIAGLDAAKRRGKRLGRPRVQVDAERVIQLRAQGTPWRRVAEQLGASESSCRRAVRAAK